MIEAESCLENPRWFVLNYVGLAFQNMAKKAIDRFNVSQNCDLSLFAPTYVVREERCGEIRMRTVNLTFHYVFVRGTYADVKLLCSQNNGFSFLIDRSGSERYATVSDREMANFKNIARAYKNCLPYFPLDEIDLEEGDLVEVVRGDFPGLVGIYTPKARGNSGNIILNVYKKVGTIAFNVKATDVRVLEFSRKSTRANDQIDAVVPHLLKALRLYREVEALPTALIAKLTVFCNRMGVVRLNNRKLDVRLQALLYGCYVILGNSQEATLAKARYKKIEDVVTNEWTSSLIELIFAVTDNDAERLKSAQIRIKELTPSSKAQHMLAEEYTFYNGQ